MYNSKNWVSKVTSTKQLIVISAVIAAIAVATTNIANFIFLAEGTRSGPVIVGTIVSIVLGFSISLYVGKKILQINRLTDELEKAASYDNLTGALLRGRFFSDLDSLVNPSGVVALLDMDSFKSINDRFGHAAGDGALRTVVDIILAQIGPNNMLCRLGGDEFVIFFRDLRFDDAETHIRSIKTSVSLEKVKSHGVEATLGVSAGTAKLSSGDNIDAVFALADAALYREKAAKNIRRNSRYGAISADQQDVIALQSP